MSGWLARAREDDGISLVEVVVGMGIILVALAAFANTLTASLLAVTGDEQVVRGNQMAAELIEFTRAAAFDCQGDATCINSTGELGFYEDDPGWAPSAADGAPMVRLGATRPGGGTAPGPLPSETIERDGTTYEVRREIVWVDDPAQPGTEDHKEVRVRVGWTLRGQERSVSTSAIRYDAPDPAAECTPGTIVDYDISPDVVTVTSSGTNLDAVVVTVETCTSAAAVTLHPDPLAARGMTEVAGSDGTRWEVRDIADGNVQFQPGTYPWRVEMTSVDGSDQQTRDVTFAESSTAVLALESIAVAPTTFCLQKSGSTYLLVGSPTVTIMLSGALEGDDVVVRWTGDPDGERALTVGPVDDPEGDGGDVTLTTTIPEGSTFAYKDNSGSSSNRITTSTISVQATRTADQTPVTRSAVVDLAVVGTAPC